MTSNGIAITPSRLHSAGRAMVLFKINMWGGEGGVSRRSSGVVIGDLVDAAAWGIVPCVSKIYTLRIEG